MSNALLVLQELTLHCPSDKKDTAGPVCAPPVPANDNNLEDNLDDNLIDEKDVVHHKYKCCESLRNNCLTFLDQHASTILASKYLVEVDISVLKMIFCRSSLNIKYEMEVFSALVRWSRAECSRLGLPDTPDTRRRVVSGCQYLVRYLTITSKDFKEEVVVSGLLDEEESDALLYTLLKPGAPLPEHLLVLRRTMEERRGGEEVVDTKVEEEEGASRIDLNISKLQELKEKELAYKDNYSFLDELFLCLRCLID